VENAASEVLPKYYIWFRGLYGSAAFSLPLASIRYWPVGLFSVDIMGEYGRSSIEWRKCPKVFTALIFDLAGMVIAVIF